MTRGRTGPLDVGDVLLEKYEIRALIGRGGHACVYHARRIFRRLWNQRKSYDVGINLGQAELNLGLYRDAAEHLSYGVRNVPPREDPAVRARSAEGLAYAKQRVGTVSVHVEPKGARIHLDGYPLGTAPLDGDLFLDPGTHELEASLAG